MLPSASSAEQCPSPAEMRMGDGLKAAAGRAGPISVETLNQSGLVVGGLMMIIMVELEVTVPSSSVAGDFGGASSGIAGAGAGGGARDPQAMRAPSDFKARV